MTPEPGACAALAPQALRGKPPRHHALRSAWPAIACIASALLLGACGGGDSLSGAPSVAVQCELRAQKSNLRGYLRDWYLFNDRMPDPDPAPFATITSYFQALLVDPPDRFSFAQDVASFDQFFGAGQTLGFGVSVAGREADPVPLRVRRVDTGSPAAAAGLQRGMVVEAINGLPTGDFHANAYDFSVLAPDAAGDVLTLTVRDHPAAATTREIRLTAAVYSLQPVSKTALLTSPLGRTVGYLLYDEFISAGLGPTLPQAIADLKARGAADLVLDLRYNGGGSVAVSRDLGSLIAGAAVRNQVFVTLQYNAQHQGDNFSFFFNEPANALGLQRVMVLAGPRTCSASELVVNSLRGVGIDAVLVGGTTCGKPYGFNPYEQCGIVYSAVNFRGVNARGEADYDNGLVPDCPVADDFDHALGDAGEGLTAAALSYLDTGACPPTAAAPMQRQSVPQRSRRAVFDGGRRPGMWPR
jgi:C-terminal processing protease CtpA/Prc